MVSNSDVTAPRPDPIDIQGYPGSLSMSLEPPKPPTGGLQEQTLAAIVRARGRGLDDQVLVAWPYTPAKGYRLELVAGPLPLAEARATLLARWA